MITDRSVRSDIGPRFLKTSLLSLLALVISVPVSVALGVFTARRIDSSSDLILTVGMVVLAALPEFMIGIGFVMLFAVALGWFPVDSAAVTVGSLGARMKAYVLPVFTLALAMVPYVTRITRATGRETLSAPYVQAAALRGLRPRTVIWDYAMRNAAIPVLNAISLNIAYLLSGVVVVENVFAFPGIGQALVAAIVAHDAITVEAIILLQGGVIIGVTLAAEFLAVYFNPRLRSETA
jgi:peptide/nickel transport system permease protein